jgi:hypothetical protein
MATWTPSALVSDIRGLLGNQVFSFQKGSHYIKTHNANPSDPNTAAQQASRSNWSDLSAWWSHLTQTQQNMWHKYASLQKRPLTGFNAFMAVNMSLYNSGIPSPTRRDHPPLTPDTPEAVRGFFPFFVHATSNAISWSAPDDAGLYVQCWKCYDWNYFSGYNQMWVILEAKISTAGWFLHNHDSPPGTYIWYRARSIDLWGRKSPFTQTVKVLSGGA